MKHTKAERRLVENELMFRQANQKVQQGLDKLKQDAANEGHTELIKNLEFKLRFYCECSDENCNERIKLTNEEYSSNHQDKKHFTVIPGHEIKTIEKIIKSTANYLVVEKLKPPPDQATRLHKTEVKNV